MPAGSEATRRKLEHIPTELQRELPHVPVERIDELVDALSVKLLVAARFEITCRCSRTGARASTCWRSCRGMGPRQRGGRGFR